jgi:hypothetical protein
VRAIVRRALAAVLAAFAGICATVVLGLTADFLTQGYTTAPMLKFLELAVMLAIFTFPGALVIFVLDRILTRLKRESAIDYAIAFAAISIVAGLAVIVIMREGSIQRLPEDLGFLLRPTALFFINGLVGGFMFWALVRPGRNVPAFWSDIF